MLFNSFEFAIFLPIVFLLLSFENKLLIESFDKSEILQTELSSELLEYFEKIKFIDKSNFIDGTHLINPNNHHSIINHD